MVPVHGDGRRMALTLRDQLTFIAAGAAAAYAYLRLYQKHTASIAALEAKIDAYEQAAHMRDTNQTRQTQALIWLHRELQFGIPLPAMRGWSVSADFAALLVELMRVHRPSRIVELGGGSSTIITAYAIREVNPQARVIAVEADEGFANKARVELNHYNVEDVAEVIHAPISRTMIGEQPWLWYDLAALQSLQAIDFLLVDGPAQHNNPRRMVRYPALPMLCDRLNPGALILMDDTNREDETLIAERWEREYPQLTRLNHYYNFEKGAYLYRWEG